MPTASLTAPASPAGAVTILPPPAPTGPKIGHWTMWNKSGMNRVAESLVMAERALGLDSHLCNIQDETNWDRMVDCDVHVSHTHFPDVMRKRLTKPFKLVWVGHGTPDHVFHSAVEADANRNYGKGDALMLMMHWLHAADARVTFWPRHQAIYQQMVSKGTPVHCLPMGVDRAFWSGGQSKGKYAGAPSVWSGENAHYIKWPYDLITAWPFVYPELDNASLHVCYLPSDMHRWFAPWINGIGAGYAMHWSSISWEHSELRNIFKSIDYFVGLVRYGDHNRLSLEANAAGATTISYRGNPYSDYWVTEGDQRELARDLVAILKGDVTPRAKTPVPDIAETARGMQAVYESVLRQKVWTGFPAPDPSAPAPPPRVVFANTASAVITPPVAASITPKPRSLPKSPRQREKSSRRAAPRRGQR